jgi:hypothetical protein
MQVMALRGGWIVVCGKIGGLALEETVKRYWLASVQGEPLKHQFHYQSQYSHQYSQE